MSVSDNVLWNNQLRQERIRRNWRQHDVAEQLGTTVVTVTRWERGTHYPSAYFRVKLCALFGKSAQDLGFAPENTLGNAATMPDTSVEASPYSPDTFRIWNVPYARNPFFTGREEVLHLLYEMLHRVHTIAFAQSCVVSGLGGIGKTQIALEYAYQYCNDYRFIF